MNEPAPNLIPGVVLEDRLCPNGCPTGDEHVLEGGDRIHGLPGRFQIVRCTTCELMRTNPRPTAQSIGAYYPSNYAPYHSTPSVPRIKPSTWHRRFKARIHRFFGRDLRRLPDMPPGHLVEIGCASGAYLVEMRARGWSVEGIEYSDEAASIARSMGIAVQTGSVESIGAPRQSAEVLAAWMVLEHLHEPVEALQKLRGWLRPGGTLVGVVPDANAFDRRLFGEHWYALHLPNHLYHYTPRSLRTVFDRAGWEVIALRWQPNCKNLLNSIEWKSEASGWSRTLRAVRWFETSPKAAKWRSRLSWLLGVTGQSGRMEFWARVKDSS